ncbi:hypothetical protein ACFL5M_05455 [Candidatus Neomarinimicrobiota bacterium]
MILRYQKYEIRPERAEREIQRFIQLIGHAEWQKKLKNTNDVAKSAHSVYYLKYLLERNPFLTPLVHYYDLINRGEPIKRHVKGDIAWLFSMCLTINRIHHNLTPKGRKVLYGRLSSDDLRALLLEIDVAVHYLQNSEDVQFNDIEELETFNGRKYDFLVTLPTIGRVEIESKWISPDAGRKIRRDAFCSFADILLKTFERFSAKCIVDIRLRSGRLSKNKTFLESISKSIIERYEAGSTEFDHGDNVSIKIKRLPNETQIRNDQEARDIVKQYYSPRAHFAISSGDNHTILIIAESEEQDSILDSIYNNLKDASTQLSGERPSIIACAIEGINSQQLEDLFEESALRLMTGSYFSNKARRHIWKITYLSDLTMESDSTGKTRPKRTSLSWDNPRFNEELFVNNNVDSSNER